MKIPAPAPLMKHPQRTQVSSGTQISLRRLACEVGALGVQPGTSTESLVSARTVDYSRGRGSMQSGAAPSSTVSQRFVGDGRLRLSGREDARSSAMRTRCAPRLIGPEKWDTPSERAWSSQRGASTSGRMTCSADAQMGPRQPAIQRPSARFTSPAPSQLAWARAHR